MTTTDPERTFTVDATPDAVSLSAGTVNSGTADAAPDVHLPAEAFARLIYGRLDPDHTPAGAEAPALDTLRRVYPGP